MKVEIYPELWDVFESCWSPNPAERATVHEVLERLDDMIHKVEGCTTTTTGAQPT